VREGFWGAAITAARHLTRRRRSQNGRSIDAQELAAQVAFWVYYGMNPGGLPFEIEIKSAHNDARMVWLRGMETNEMFSIEGQYGPVLAVSELKDCRVASAAIVKTGFVSSQDIVPELTKCRYDRQRKVLVCEELCHLLCSFVLSNLPIDLVLI
jgi:hypothetical protein